MNRALIDLLCSAGSTLRALRFAPVFCAALLSGAAPATPIETVFDNSAAPGIPSGGPGCCRIGDEITLAGTFRQIVNISLAVWTPYYDRIAPVELRIYANDGFGGAPGTVLWDSGIQLYQLQPGQRFIDFAVPSVLVPDTITVTSWTSSWGFGRFLPSETTVGTFASAWVEPDYLPGIPWIREVPAFSFQVRVDAVDEPGTAVLTMLAAALLFGFRSSPLGREQAVGPLGLPSNVSPVRVSARQ